MSKCILAKLLREEIYNLTRIAEALEDKSELCYPNVYDCFQCLKDAARNLKRIKRLSKGIHSFYRMDVGISNLMEEQS